MISNKREITQRELELAFKVCGIEKGDLLLMHSALSSIGDVKGGADTVIDALLNVLGEDGTLAVVAMSGQHPFDPETAPSTVGIISETLRRRKGAFRSLKPVHSVAAYGKKAEEFTSGHDVSETNCGEGTPYTKLRDMGGKILMLGVDMNRNTTLHSIEDIMDSYYLENRTVPAPVYMKDYEGKTMTMRKFPPGHRDFLKFTSVLRRNGALIEGIAGNARMLLIDVKKMFELGEKMLEKDPDYFLCENDECAYCRGKKDARDNEAK